MARFRSVKALARYLKLKPPTVYTLVAKKKIPHIRIGRLIRFTDEQIAEFVRGCVRGADQVSSNQVGGTGEDA